MSIKNNILDKIKRDHIEPISKSTVLRRKYLLIILLFLLIGLGIFIVSFFISDVEGLGELIEMDTIYIIFLWIISIILLGIFIYKDARHVGTLYRYDLKKGLGIIFSIMLVGGLLLHLSGTDDSIQKFLIRYTGYEGIMSTYANWSKPEQGKLIGEIIRMQRDSVIIRDLQGRNWKILLPDNLRRDHKHNHEENIEEGDSIKISGKLQENNVFMAETVTPLFE